jgi:hypothetical protein
LDFLNTHDRVARGRDHSRLRFVDGDCKRATSMGA